MAEAEPAFPLGAVHRSIVHDSGFGHVTGSVPYTDDITEPKGILHCAFGLAPVGRGRILSLDLTEVKSAPGVVLVLTAGDIPGENNVGPVVHDEPLLAEGEVLFHGQPVFLVAATSRGAARRAARLAMIEVEPIQAVLTIDEARAAGTTIEPAQYMRQGDHARALAAAPHRLAGAFEMGGQEHFYLEGQIAMALPGEDNTFHIYSSTQHPSEIQHLVALMLRLNSADVTVEVRRMGGGFGGKETQAAPLALATALVAAKTGRPAKLRYDRDDDMMLTGKRHDFQVAYSVGFDDAGRIAGLQLDLASRCGATTDLSPQINDRALFHSDNVYYLGDVEIASHRLRTDTVSNTAFRGFGGPQGMLAIERVMDHVADATGLDPLDVRRINLYGEGRDTTPYGMTVADNIAPELIAELERSSRYRERSAEVAAFNASHRLLKKGLALTPVKFGISFTTPHLNQAGALVLVYADGSVHLNHGGTEMGQGLFTKVAQIVADVFAVPIEQIRISATRTDKVPNTSATAASSGSDLNGMAAWNAAMSIRERLAELAGQRAGVPAAEVEFAPEGVVAGATVTPFRELCRLAHFNRISLAASGFYATPGIEYDRTTHKGRPFYYFAYGAAVSEVVIDLLTGEHRVLAADILHDTGNSLNPAIDLGQIEGAFVQGMGWLTTEELVFGEDGRLLTHAPSTYKIPTASDRPARMDVRLWASGHNTQPTIHRSKAVGEPPFMLAISVFAALTAAVKAAVPGKGFPKLDAPATPERILAALADLKRRDG